MGGFWYYQSEGLGERISSPPGHVIDRGVAPRVGVVTRGGGGSNSLKNVFYQKNCFFTKKTFFGKKKKTNV